MHTRIVIGAGAWLLGAAAATGGSLLVVSRLGEGIAASPSQQPAVSAVNQAQGSGAARPPSSPKPQFKSGTGGKNSTGSTGATSSTNGTVLTSSGGTVLARCATAGTYLLSWSPQQGFQASSVVRGPATTTRAVFTTGASTVTMVVTCSGGVPSAATTVTNAEVDDNGGGNGNQGKGGGGGGDG